MDAIIYGLSAISMLFCWRGSRKYALVFFAFSFLMSIVWFAHHLTTSLSINL